MNIRQYVNPADGMVQLQTKDGKTISRWPIDAQEMIAKGGAKPVAVRAASPESAPATAATSSDTEDDE